jgi:hypothetical protein
MILGFACWSGCRTRFRPSVVGSHEGMSEAAPLSEFEFEEQDLARMHELAVKVQAGALDEDEEAELESYRRIGRLLDLMRSKARRSPRKSGSSARASPRHRERRTIMQAATRIPIIIPADRRVELELPDDLPVGPAEVIVLVPFPGAPPDSLDDQEAALEAASDEALAQDGRFRAEGRLVVFEGAIPPELQDELDHRRDRERRLDDLGREDP